MRFKVGDKVRCKWNDNGSSNYVGSTGTVTSVNHSHTYPYDTTIGPFAFRDAELELISADNPIKSMGLIEKAKLAFKSEPEKSFIKVGVMDSNENLTTEGKELLMHFLLEKNKDAFKTEVVDPILAEDKD